MKTTVRIALLFSLLLAASACAAQDDRRWWQRLFKPETIEEMEQVPDDGPIVVPVKPAEEAPGQIIRTETDTTNLTPPLFERGQGHITFRTTASIDSLEAFRFRNPQPLQGYRIQLFEGNVAAAREKRGEVMTNLSDRCYVVQTRPYFAVRIGDFRTELDAYRRLMEIRAQFPGAYVVADRIEPPKVQ